LFQILSLNQRQDDLHFILLELLRVVVAIVAVVVAVVAVVVVVVAASGVGNGRKPDYRNYFILIQFEMRDVK